MLQSDGDGLVILRFDRIDEGEELTVDRLFIGGALIGAHDVCSLDIRAVGELRSVTQSDFVLGVGNLDGISGSKCGGD